jgi:hypothetical protein
MHNWKMIHFYKSCFFIVTSPTNAVQSSGKQKSGRGRKKMVGKRHSDEGANSVAGSETATAAMSIPFISNSAVGGSGPQSASDSNTRGK